MLRDKVDWALSHLGDLSREFFALVLAVLINELRKILWGFILGAIGLKPKGVTTMVKAYDVKDLVEKLKARGLDVAEEMAVVIIEETLTWVDESAVLSENKIDDVARLGIEPLKKLALKLADKIDGKEG